VETEANRQDGNLVLPPGKPDQVSPPPSVAITDAALALQAMAAAASAGLPVSKATTRDTVALIREHIRGLVEDTRENHLQAKAAPRLSGVRKSLPFWTAKSRLYLIENILFSVGNWQSHLWTAW
jgi:hypothetical protein